MNYSKAIISFSIVALCVFSFEVAQAQEAYNPAFLIPYNDHGKWGFSDTLGNVKIEPEFEAVSFFFDIDEAMVSRVQRGEEETYYVLNKGCMTPVGYDSDYIIFWPVLMRNNLCEIEKADKVGLFNFETQEIVIDTDYSKSTIDEENGMIYFSRYDEKRKGMNILAYDINSKEQRKLNYVEMRIEGVRTKGEIQEYILFRDKRNRWFEFENGEWLRFPYDDMDFIEGYEEDDHIRTSAASPGVPKKLFQEVPSYRTNKIEGATVYSSIAIGDYRDFQVMWKDGSFGLYQESTQLLPFNYDFIDIDYEHGFFYLLGDKKMGVYLPGTTYPIIEPRYDLVRFYKKLPVNDKWLFVLFNVKMNGSNGYLGENGVEFFNFD